MLIDKLLNAMASLFIGGSANATLTTAFGGRYFRDQAEGSPAMPYVVAELAPVQPLTDAYANRISTDTTVILKVVGNGHNATAANMSSLMGVLDNTTLTLTGATNHSMYRVSEPVGIKLPEDEFGVDVWQWGVSYVYSVC